METFYTMYLLNNCISRVNKHIKNKKDTLEDYIC